MLKPNSSILSCCLPLMLKLKQNISRSYFLIIAVCNRVQYFSNPVMMKYFWKDKLPQMSLFCCSQLDSGFINILKYQYLNVETEFKYIILLSSVDVDIEVKYIQKLFLDHRCLQPSSILSNPVTMKYFGKTNYHRCRCSVAASWILGLSIF
ncbi:Hypothetical_protein [Hexamita inflata]|uniref:Hypothetical_protein n=1 Tax=Hexamita inflata TaxID=28002 RepID=A0AA86N7R4_9EUKA|nr:Hypothetical protein HINF_LOCUS2075 [Hexamita inflata]